MSPPETKAKLMAVGSNLFKAAVKGHIKPFKKRAHDLMQIVNESKDTILHVHINKSSSSSAEFVEGILNICPELLQQVNDQGNTPLHLAARWGESHTVEVLLKDAELRDIKTMMLMMKNNDGKTAFHVAMENGSIKVVKRLIKEGDPNFFDFANNIGKLLNLAAKSGDPEILDEIQKKEKGGAALLQELKKPAGPWPKDTVLHIHIKTAIKTSTRKESTEFAKKILDIYPPIRLTVNDEGNTPLHVAAECNNYQAAQVLLQRVRDDQSQDPERNETAKVLVEHVRDDQSQDPKRRERDITEMLNLKNNNGKTAFDLAVDKGNIEVANILIKEAKSDVFDFAKSISKILNLAAERGHHEILDSILIHEKGKAALVHELSEYDNPGMQDTILHSHIKSSGTESTEFVEKILNLCPSLLFKKAEGDLPIHVAAKCYKSKIAEVLLKHARNHHPESGDSAISKMLNAKNGDGKTAFELAVEKKNIKVVKVLVKGAEADIFNIGDVIGEILNLATYRGDHEILEEIARGEKGKRALFKELSKKETAGMDSVLHININSFWSSSEFVEYVLYLRPSLLLQVNADNDTPLHVAAKWGEIKIVEILLKSAKEKTHQDQTDQMLQMKNSDEKTAFDLAVEYGNPEVLTMLIKEAGPHFSYFANIMGKILNLAAERGDFDLLKALSDGDDKRKTALIQELRKYDIPGTHSKEKILHTHIKSFRAKSKDFVEKLLELCPSLQLQVDDNGDTPIHVAVKRDEFDIAEVLLKHANKKTQEQADREERTGNSVWTCGQYEIKKVRKRARDQSQTERHDWKIWERKNGDGKTILDIAVENEKVEAVNLLIKAVPKFWDFEKNFSKILYFAARRGDYDIAASAAKSLTKETALDGPILDVNIPEGQQSNDTILHVHIKYSKKSSDFMKKMLDKCPSLLVKVNEKGDTPLHAAAKCGHHNMVEFLLKYAKDKRQDLESGLRTYWETMTNTEGKKADGQMIRMMNSEGNIADWWQQILLNLKNNEGNTALHEAVQHGKFEVVKLLIKADSSVPYVANKAGETPLYLAATRGYYRLVHEILEKCKSVAYEGPNGMTALHAAVMKFDTPGSKSVANGNPNGMANSDDSDSDDTDFDDAEYEDSSKFTSLQVMKEIIKKRRSLTIAKDQYGWTPLHYASYYGLSEKVDLLLRSDKSAAYITDKDRKMTALHMAASQGHKHIIEKIISKCVGCCEMVDNRDWNVLHFAMISLSKEELDVLLRNPSVGTLINKQDKDGNTPLHIRAAVYRDSFFHVGNREVVNKENFSVKHIIKNGSAMLEEEIQKLFEDFGDGQYQKGVICERKNDDYFKTRSEGRKRYYERLKEAKEYHLLVATLIATITFTAAFTIPGGYNGEKGSEKGTAILYKNLAFQTFITTDTVAMTLSLSAVFVHFIMSFKKHERLLSLALWLTILSMGTVVIAFVTGVYAVLAPSLGLAVAVCVLGLCIFLLVLHALKLAYWRVFLEWLIRPLRKPFKSKGGRLPIYVKKGN